jgi:hypothetical protein
MSSSCRIFPTSIPYRATKSEICAAGGCCNECAYQNLDSQTEEAVKNEIGHTPSVSNLCTFPSLILAWMSAGIRIDTFLHSPLPRPSVQIRMIRQRNFGELLTNVWYNNIEAFDAALLRFVNCYEVGLQC